MPLQLPNLDDRAYADLVEEALALIPRYAPEWTNYNPSDPGITLIELFAYLTDMLLYRLNRVTEAQMWGFLRLLNGPQWLAPAQLDEAIQETVKQLRQPQRAVTSRDFVELAKQAAPGSIRRVHCVPRSNLEAAYAYRPGHVSIIVMPDAPQTLDAVRSSLDERRLLTTRVHVVAPRYVTVRVQLTLVLKPDAAADTVRQKAIASLEHFFAPLPDGSSQPGWPFGRAVYVSDVYTVLHAVEGVDYITRTDAQPALLVETAERLEQAGNELIAVRLRPDRLRPDGLVTYAHPPLLLEAAERVEQADNELIAVRLRPDELVMYQYQDGDLTCYQV
jgi:Baseplate J-like protein